MAHRSLNYYAPSYFRMARLFRNGLLVAWRHYWRRDLSEAVFWNGRRFSMPPGRGGLADTVVEMWGGEAYTSNNFYAPAPGDVVLDIGANVGAFSLWVAQRSPQTRVIAVEPSQENLTVLERNLAGWPNRVTTQRLAVGGRSGGGVIVDGGGRSIDHRVEPGDSEVTGVHSVEIVTLMGLLDQIGVECVDLLKMDVEGGEFDVFSEVTEATLKRLRRISLEYHDNLRPGTLALLKQRLAGTHAVELLNQSAGGYGILRAVLRKTQTD